MALFERSRLLMYWLMWKTYEAQMRLDDVSVRVQQQPSPMSPLACSPPSAKSLMNLPVGLPDESAYEAAD